MSRTRWNRSSSRIRCWSAKSLRTRSISAFSIDRARESLSTPSRVNTRTSITVPSMPGGTRSPVSFTSEAFSPKIARRIPDVGDVGGDFLRSQLGVARHTGELLDVDGREAVFLHHPL